MRDATLVALARTPLLAPDDLAFLCAIGGRGARRALDARVAAGEAGYVADSATRRHLYFLTAAGVEAAARLMRADPGELTGRYGLGEPALLRRLPALWRLVAGRAILLRLARALADAGGALEEWRAYPVRWPFARGGRREALVLDGEVTLRFADGARCVVGLLWDGDADAPPGALAARLDRLAGARSDPAYAPPYPTRVPPVLLATTSAARVPPGYRPGLLWATTGALAAADPLTVAWRGASGPGGGDEGSPLRAALDRLGRMPPRPTPAATMRVPTTRAAPRRPDALRRRAARVRASPTIEHTPQDLAALPLVLPPRAWPLLHCVGAHPLLGRHDLATVLGRDPFDTWELLRALRAHGLCAAWLPQRSGHAWRYSLTKRGWRRRTTGRHTACSTTRAAPASTASPTRGPTWSTPTASRPPTWSSSRARGRAVAAWSGAANGPVHGRIMPATAGGRSINIRYGLTPNYATTGRAAVSARSSNMTANRRRPSASPARSRSTTPIAPRSATTGSPCCSSRPALNAGR